MSTNINQLPNMNQDISIEDDDDAIQEVLAEIQNEQSPQMTNEPPPIPMEAMQQLPPQPDNNQLKLQQELINSLQMELQNQKNNNEEPIKNYINNTSQTTSRFQMVLDNLKKDTKLIVLIAISFIILQNETIRNLITSKLPSINIPYFDLILFALIQVILIIIGRNFV